MHGCEWPQDSVKGYGFLLLFSVQKIDKGELRKLTKVLGKEFLYLVICHKIWKSHKDMKPDRIIEHSYYVTIPKTHLFHLSKLLARRMIIWAPFRISSTLPPTFLPIPTLAWHRPMPAMTNLKSQCWRRKRCVVCLIFSSHNHTLPEVWPGW